MDRGTSKVRTQVVAGRARRVAVAAALLVPLAVGPHGVDTPGTKVLLLTLCGLAALALKGVEVMMGRPSRDRLRAPDLALLGLGVWSLLSMGWALNPDLARIQGLMLLGMFGVAWSVQEMAADSRAVRHWILGILVVGLVAMAIDTVAIRNAAQQLSAHEFKYASVLFVHNNMAAVYAAMLGPMMLALALGARRRMAGLLWLVPLAGLLAYLDLLNSRAGLVATVGSTLVVLVLFGLRRFLATRSLTEGRWTVLLIAAVVVAALLPLSPRVRGVGKDLYYRATGLLELSAHEDAFRPLLWAKTMEMVSEQPVTGVGAGNFPVVFARFEKLRAAKPHAHNDVLHLLAEVGLPGLLLLLGLLTSLGWILLRVMVEHAEGRRFPLAAGLAGSLVVFVASGLFEIPLLLGSSAGLLALVLGLAAVLDGPDGVAVGRKSMRWPLGALLLLATLPCLWTAARRVPGPWLMHAAEQQREAGETGAARIAYERVAALRTGSAVPFRTLGVMALEEGDGATALEHFEAARRLWPFGGASSEDEGDALTLMGRHAEAVQRYGEAVEQNPGRTGPLYKLIGAIEQTGDRRRAVEMLNHEVAAHPLIPMEAVTRLAWMWRSYAGELQGEERVEALVASRHFFALCIQDGDVDEWPEFNEAFKHITHQLQRDHGGDPDGWWPVYQRFLDEGGWRMPTVALYSSIDDDGVKLYPGWVEPEGPPLPRSQRH